MVLASCGSDVGSSELAASGAWSRPTPATADEAVVYLTLTTDEVDEVEGASVDPAVAAEVQLHATSVADGGGTHSHGGGGGAETVSMGEVEAFDVAPDAPLVFEPGGNHLMLVGLVAPLESGDAFELELELASGRSLTVDVPVQVNAP